jgi:hypothetical protein
MKYYSEKLNKLFDKEEDLKAAEKVVAEQEAAKLEAAKNKKQEAKVVEDAFKARNAARREYNEKVISLRKEYHDVVVAAKTKFEEGIAEAAKAKDESENAYSEALKEFTDKHPEGYHMTLKDGDNVITLSRASDKQYEKISKEYNDFIDTFVKFFNF